MPPRSMPPRSMPPRSMLSQAMLSRAMVSRAMVSRAMVLATALLLVPVAVPGAQARPTLSDAERQRAADARAGMEAAQAAKATAAAEAHAAQARVDGAARLRTAESRLADLSTQLDALQAERTAAQARLKATADQLAPLLPLIERMAAYPAETILAVPLAPDDAVRGLVVLRGLAGGIGAEAGRLRARQAELAAAEAAVAAALPGLRAAHEAQSAEAAALDAQLVAAHSAHMSAEGAATEAARRAAASAAQAETLRGALAKLEADRHVAEARADAEASRAARQKRPAEAAVLQQKREDLARPAGPGVAENALVVPVVGRVRGGWGAASESGHANGISYATSPGARVVSPCAGRVAFAGPFRSYGVLVIVDCGGGFHAVLAGIGRVDAAIGRSVLAGEPVGIMGEAQPSLYVELRRGGRAIDPTPFLKAPS